MKNRKWFIALLLFILIVIGGTLYLLFSHPNVPNINEVESVAIRIYGFEDDISVVLNTSENIREVLSIHRQLEDYQDPLVETWFMNLDITYRMNDGSEVSVSFNDIRPLDDYLEDIYNSEEYKEQTISVFTMNEDQIDRAIIVENMMGIEKGVETSDPEVIRQLIADAKNTHMAADNKTEYFGFGEIRFMTGDKMIANCPVYREIPYFDETISVIDDKLFQIEAYFDDISCIIIDNDRSSIEVRDEMLIEEIFNSYYPFYSSESSDYSVEIVFNDDERRHLYGSFLIGQVPDAIIDLFEDHLTSKDFISKWHLNVEENPIEFEVTVPENWNVELGQYPEGLYWGIADVLSEEVGLDLNRLKGKQVDVQVYALSNGLPGKVATSGHTYDSDLILLLENGRTVGAWQSFNRRDIGPSVSGRYLDEITGMTYSEWIQEEGYFYVTEATEDLKDMEPARVLEEFFEAINKGDTDRVVSCISPRSLKASLTVNKQDNELYNQDFGDSTLVYGIEKAELLSYKYMDFDTFKEIEGYQNIGDRTVVEMAADVYIDFAMEEFNTPDNRTIRFPVFRKYENGWKIEGIGSGP